MDLNCTAKRRHPHCCGGSLRSPARFKATKRLRSHVEGKGKEFAHFHDANELDLRLTKATIRELGLQHPPGSLHHPTRSQNSAWIEVRFTAAADIQQAVELVRVAIAKL